MHAILDMTTTTADQLASWWVRLPAPRVVVTDTGHPVLNIVRDAQGVTLQLLGHDGGHDLTIHGGESLRLITTTDHDAQRPHRVVYGSGHEAQVVTCRCGWESPTHTADWHGTNAAMMDAAAHITHHTPTKDRA